MATQAIATPGIGSNKAVNIGLWALQIGAAFMLIFAGFSKLSGDPQMVGLFSAIGVGQWFRYLTGGLEVIGSIGLLIPRLSGYGAALLVPVMLGAVATHLFIIGGSPLTALLLLTANVVIAISRLKGLRQ